MKSAVIVYPGTNRERDVARALRLVTGADPVMVWHGDSAVPDVDLIVLPGGFAYGDYLRAGAIAARSPVMADVAARARAGTRVLGICNGFQVLTETGLLPGALMRNAALKFVCREAHLRVETAETAFTRAYAKGQLVRFPVAHHDGNYFADPDTLDRLEGEGRVVFRYVSPGHDSAPGGEGEGDNFNGSQRAIAGIVNEAGNVLGLMPHPENLVEPALGGTDGRGLFESLMAA